MKTAYVVPKAPTFRKLKAADSERIKCGGHHRQSLGERCQNQATYCRTVEWQTGNTPGISFFYMCDEGKASFEAANV